MSNFSITGRIHSGGFPEQKGDNFTVRLFTLEVTENASGNVYSNFIGFQLANDKCALLDNFAIGQAVTVHFNLRGSLWQGKTITNLQAWKIEVVQSQQPAPQQYQQQAPQQQQWQQPQQPQQPQQFPPQQPAYAPPAQQQNPQQQQWPQQQPQQQQPAFGAPQQGFGNPQPQQQPQFIPQPSQSGDLPF